MTARPNEAKRLWDHLSTEDQERLIIVINALTFDDENARLDLLIMIATARGVSLQDLERETRGKSNREIVHTFVVAERKH